MDPQEKPPRADIPDEASPEREVPPDRIFQSDVSGEVFSQSEFLEIRFFMQIRNSSNVKSVTKFFLSFLN